MGLISEMVRAMGAGERLRFEIQNAGDDKVIVMVQPYLGSTVSVLDDQAAQLRAALAMPLRLTGDVATIDVDVVETVREYGARRGEVAEKVKALETLREASKAGTRLAGDAQGAAGEAKNAASKGGEGARKGARKGESGALAEDTSQGVAPEVAPSAPSAPDSLFF